MVTQDDLPYIVSDVLNRHDAMEERVKLLSYMVSTSYGLKPIASLKVEINGKVYTADATGDGQYNAFVKALRKVYRENLNRTFPRLTNYSVTIRPADIPTLSCRPSSHGRTTMAALSAHTASTPTRQRLLSRLPSRCSTALRKRISRRNKQ